jgi:hypothetical protein
MLYSYRLLAFRHTLFACMIRWAGSLLVYCMTFGWSLSLGGNVKTRYFFIRSNMNLRRGISSAYILQYVRLPRGGKESLLIHVMILLVPSDAVSACHSSSFYFSL